MEELRATSELFSDSVEADTQVGLLLFESRYFDLRIRTGESLVDGRATQSIMLVKKVDIVRSEGEGGEVVGGGVGVEVEMVSLSFCEDMICILVIITGLVMSILFTAGVSFLWLCAAYRVGFVLSEDELFHSLHWFTLMSSPSLIEARHPLTKNLRCNFFDLGVRFSQTRSKRPSLIVLIKPLSFRIE